MPKLHSSIRLILVIVFLLYTEGQVQALGPDLIGTINGAKVEHHQDVSAADVAEGCAVSTKDRSLLRFTFTSHNIGDEDLNIGDPMCPDCHEFPGEACNHPTYPYICSAADGHGHPHLLGFAEYLVLDPEDSHTVVSGHKESFCLRDNICVNGATPKFDCENSAFGQGLTAGCSDIYGAGLGCQYVDVTDLAPGNYILSAEVNSGGSLTEVDHGNNITEVAFTMTAKPLPDLVPKLSLGPVIYKPDSENYQSCPWLASATRLLPLSLIVQNVGNYPLTELSSELPFAKLSVGSEIDLPVFPLCVSDNSCIKENATTFSCSNQGLGKTCSSSLIAEDACGSIDISGLAPGKYDLNAVIDPEQSYEESNSANNLTSAEFEICSHATTIKTSIGAPSGLFKERTYNLRGRLPHSFGKPFKHGMHIEVSIAGKFLTNVQIPSAKSNDNCGDKDGWRFDSNLRRWTYTVATGYLDASCQTQAQGLKSITFRKRGRKWSFRLLGKTTLLGEDVTDTPSAVLKTQATDALCSEIH